VRWGLPIGVPYDSPSHLAHGMRDRMNNSAMACRMKFVLWAELESLFFVLIRATVSNTTAISMTRGCSTA